EERVRWLLVAVVPGDEALAALGAATDQAIELGVVDEGGGPLALDDLGDLGAGEGGVQVEGVGPELRAGDDRVDKAAVVAAHDRDAVTLLDARVPQPVSERVGPAVD